MYKKTCFERIHASLFKVCSTSNYILYNVIFISDERDDDGANGIGSFW